MYTNSYVGPAKGSFLPFVLNDHPLDYSPLWHRDDHVLEFKKVLLLAAAKKMDLCL